MEGLTRIPGGGLIVFGIGILVAVIAFTARSRQTRRAAPPAPTTQPAQAQTVSL
jgi:hypothetical protein